MPDLNSRSVAEQVACFNCFGANGTAQMIRLTLLAQIVTALDSMADLSPQALLAGGKCFVCYGLSPGEVMEIQLLVLLSQAIGGGISGATGVYFGTTAQRNATTPPGTAAIWILTDSDPQYQFSLWNGSAWI